MLFDNGKINILIQNDNFIPENTCELEKYMDISKLHIKSSCNFRCYKIALTNNNMILFISPITNGSILKFEILKYEITGIVQLTDINPNFIEVYHSEMVFRTDNGETLYGPSGYELGLYTINTNNSITLIKIGVKVGEMFREYKILESTTVDFTNIIHIKPLDDFKGFTLYDDNDLLILDKNLKIIHKRYIKNANHALATKNYSSYVINNEIFLYDNITDKLICNNISYTFIKKMIHLNEYAIYTLDNEYNLYIHKFSVYNKSMSPGIKILNTEGHNILILETPTDPNLVLENGKIYSYNITTGELILRFNDNTNIIVHANNKQFNPYIWNIHNHILFDEHKKNNIKIILLCNKITNYPKIYKLILYNIFSRMCT